jgi:hypothetical protein
MYNRVWTRAGEPRTGPTAKMEPLLRLLDAVDGLPEWLRPVAYGPLMVATWMTAKGVLVLGPPLVALALWKSNDPVAMLVSGATALAVVFGASAVGGLAYSTLGRPINRASRLGWLPAGWITMSPYFFGLTLVVRTSHGIPLSAPFVPFEWLLVGITTLIFGTQIGYMFLRPGALD